MTEKQTKESFTVTIERFKKDGERFAVIEINNTLNLNPVLQTYCDKEEIINKAFYNAYTLSCRELNNAGLDIKAEGKHGKSSGR